MFYAGDDAAAKAEVRKVLDAIGYFPVDLGTLAVGGRLSELPFGALSASQFIKI
jgi:predicted dinucleotide-binding enzyme